MDALLRYATNRIIELETMLLPAIPEIILRDYRGKKYTKDKQITSCGNAVPPQLAEALVRANLPEMCVQREDQAA
ncbi:hypothetical protein ACKW9G_003931 [Escherichia coli]|uniref:hypothetical protein n=1 Tax=Escherichia coli TaxID=562 RepID=UPI0005CD9076|nr:hypothetical protein [Escherichia coli]EHW2741470.1 hypothetical protein [Escherichia coli]EHX7847985.1 hypothetical protein [Escherichia coli]EHY2965800.1 hypothetical protein [Escherichia coli]ELX0475424.1 hypothetical protein [Escherichia coli]ELX0480607.1 hypothetical protein [Escherichia coli]